MRGLICGLVILACAGSAAQAARPDPASDCGRSIWRISGLEAEARRLAACYTGSQPRAVAQGRPVLDPAAALRQGLIW
jgi:hypothetical protein